ncbi:MAG: hypothetical protein ACRDVZ_04560, partial [Jiangellaceae bacterium]
DEIWQQCVQSHDGDLGGRPEELRVRWRAAGHLHTPATGVGTAGEVAVPILDGAEQAVSALAASVSEPVDPTRVAEIATHLTRTATAAGRMLGHG